MSQAKLSGAGLQIAQVAAANSQALTSTPGLLALWSTIGSNEPGAASSQSDFSVTPDKANNRIVVTAPGIYRYDFFASFVQSVAAVVTARVRKAGTALTTSPVGAMTCTTGTNNLKFSGVFVITEADIANGTGIAAYPDPASGGVIGAAFAPKTGVAIDIDLAAASNGNFVVTDARFGVERIG